MDRECLVCKSKNLKSYDSRISDFTASRMSIPLENRNTKLFHCLDCGFAFYEYRFSEDETTKFYLGYRNEEYQKQRQLYDCWYTPELNEIIGKNEKEIINRQHNMLEMITKNIEISKIRNVLDFGGDKGQNIPDIFKDVPKYVYELSNVEPIEGVILLSSEQDLTCYDFIICQGVFEHVSDLNIMLDEFKKISTQDTYFYIEVPFDSPFYKSPLHNLQFLFSKYYSLKNIIKHYINMKKSKSFAPMSEHQNYFTQKSLEILLSNNDFEILDSDVKEVDHVWCREKSINILAKLKRDNKC
ncbi:MAG: methyltransferase domain-containing protein [Clostridium sp.]|nr:methyltransferase domain-containing protein [Clostridium sp.]